MTTDIYVNGKLISRHYTGSAHSDEIEDFIMLDDGWYLLLDRVTESTIHCTKYPCKEGTARWCNSYREYRTDTRD